jgi:hypothetical protein
LLLIGLKLREALLGVQRAAERDRELVTVGLFDDANGLVEVKSSSLAAGQQVLLPATTAT